MIPTQLLLDLGYKGAIIILSDDWHSNRHIQVSDNLSLCRRKIIKQGKVYTKGKFMGYKPGAYTTIWGFYGDGRCKECLRRYLQHRLSEKGQTMIRKARALRFVQEWTRNRDALVLKEKLAKRKARIKARARRLLGLPVGAS
jgi:hypothetical protein